jgi:hypothetical protein
MKLNSGFIDFNLIVIICAMFALWVLMVYPYRLWDASEEKVQKVEEVLIKSQNQPFAKEIKLIAEKAQKNGTISNEEADLILKEYEKQSLKLKISQLN